VRQLPRSADARVEPLPAGVVAIPAVGFQEVMTAIVERESAVAAVEIHDTREPFLTQVAQVRLTRAGRVIAWIAEVAFRHGPKRAEGCERAAIIAVQFVPAIAVEHDLAFHTARQVEAFDEGVSRIVRAFTCISIAFASVIVAIAHIVVVAIWDIPDVEPRHIDIARVAIAVS